MVVVVTAGCGGGGEYACARVRVCVHMCVHDGGVVMMLMLVGTGRGHELGLVWFARRLQHRIIPAVTQ